MNVKSSVIGLRGVLMTLVAALAIGVSSSSAKAAPADTVVYTYDATVQVIANQYYATTNMLQLQMTADVHAGIAQGKSFVELHKIVDKYEKKFAKAIKTARKGVVKAEKQALKDLRVFGSPPGHVAYVVSRTQSSLNYLNNTLISLDSNLNLWLLAMLT